MGFVPQLRQAAFCAALLLATQSVLSFAGTGLATSPRIARPSLQAPDVRSTDGIVYVGGTQYPTIQAAIAAAPAGGARVVIPPGNYTWSSNVFSALSGPIQLDFAGPSEVDITATQTIATNNVSIGFAGPNPSINRIGSASPESPQTAGLRFRAAAGLSGPMFRVAGPVLGFNLTNVHFDCNANATWAVESDRMQESVWTGIISADNCSAGGFRFPNNASGTNQDTNFNQIGALFVTRSPACVTFEQNRAETSNFSHNIIQEIGCSLLGTEGATDEVLFQGADGNWLSRVWCQIRGGRGTAKSCVHFSRSSYSNQIGTLDPGIPSAPGVIQDAGNSYPNWIGNLGLGNWISAGGNQFGNQVIPNGPITWSDTGYHHLAQQRSAASSAASIPGTVLVAQPSSTDNITVTLYMWQSTLGVRCGDNTTVLFTLSYVDQTDTAQTRTATLTILNNGSIGLNQSQEFVINAKTGTTVSYSTKYSQAKGCTSAPQYAFNLGTVD